MITCRPYLTYRSMERNVQKEREIKMKCPDCNGKVRTIDSVNTRYNEVYRKRKCTECGYIFYTCECTVKSDVEFKEEWNLSYRRNKKKEKEKNNEM